MNAIRFVLKSFFGGCFGCLGALSLMTVMMLVFGLVLGPKLVSGASGLLGSLPSLLSGGLPMSGSQSTSDNQNMTGINPTQTFSGTIPPMEVFLTRGNSPEGERITTFKKSESKDVFFWVQAPENTTMRFEMILTIPNQGDVQFGPVFSTDPSGAPVNCGQFGETTPPAGQYRLRVVPEGSTSTAAETKFTITE